MAAASYKAHTVGQVGRAYRATTELGTDVVFVAEVDSLKSLPDDALQLDLRNPTMTQGRKARVLLSRCTLENASGPTGSCTSSTLLLKGVHVPAV